MGKKISKILILFLIIFIFINISVDYQCFATNSKLQPVDKVTATVAKSIIGVAQVLVSGYFVVKITMLGISYFSVVATAAEKAQVKNRFAWTLFFAVVAFLGMYLFSVGLGL